MDYRRKRWYAALGVFLIWVAALGAIAVFSGHRPTHHPRALLRAERAGRVIGGVGVGVGAGAGRKDEESRRKSLADHGLVADSRAS
jgi:hypothetical protein